MKKLFVISAVALAVLTGCAAERSTVTAEQRVQQQVPGQVFVSPNDERQYKTLVLPNKLEVILVSDPTTEKSAASLSVGVGLLQDPMSQQGMAHYLEHLLFMGTERYPDPASYNGFMAQNGGAANAYTWLDITNYMFQINNPSYDEALDRFSDFFKAPLLLPEYTEKERNAVNAEWSMRREMDFFGQFKLARSMFGEHPANRFLIGNLETLSDKENSNLHAETVKFYQQYYSANTMKLALLSNLPLAEMELLARKHFAGIENKEIARPAVDAELNYQDFGAKRVHYVPNEDVKQLRLDFTITNNSDEFAVKPNEFITYLLGSEMPGSPAQQLKALGLISSLSASADPGAYGNYGNLTIDISLTDAGMAQREAIIATVMQYLDLIKRQGVDSKYFSEIQTSLANRFRFLEKTDGFGYVSNLAHAMQFVPAEHAVNAPYYYQKFDADAINRVLQQLKPESLRVWYISQQEPHDSELHFYDGRYKITDISEQEIASWQQSPVATNLPAVNRLLPENFELRAPMQVEKPELVVEDKGIKAWLYPSQEFASQPRGRLNIYLNSPAAIEDIKAKVMFALWQDLYNLEQSVLATEASVAGMDLSLNDSNGLVLSLGGFTDKQPELLQQALAGLTPEVTAERFSQAVDRYVRGIRNLERRFPFQQAFMAFNSMYRGGNYNNEQLISSAEQLTAADLQQFMQQILAKHQVRIFAFGNYNQADVKQLVNTVAATLPAERTTVPYTRSPVWQPAPGQVISLQQDLVVADVALVDMHIHPDPSVKQLARGRLLQSHFSNKAFDTLRTEEQLAYAVGGAAVSVEDYTGFGLYIQTPVKSVVDMQQRFDEFKQQYWLSLQQLDEAGFEQLKQSLLVSLKEPPKNLQEEMAPLISDWYQEKFNFDSKQKLIAEVEQLTLEDIKAFYQQTLLNKDAARISVQMRGTGFSQQPFATIEGQQVITDLADFHRQMKTQ
ncbi:insulinase family protein [Arsukibacterium indicum]|uniref:Protease 3 n=1 Tax=Arsukibacterium indicum TaxID=2848612 RepID=A0ABS6MK51_9GAMM|nr:insulinase family protein [Arsukibacterium indicum]MBV2129179.1 insulinase family protein [Arsukibacterium indicum]